MEIIGLKSSGVDSASGENFLSNKPHKERGAVFGDSFSGGKNSSSNVASVVRDSGTGSNSTELMITDLKPALRDQSRVNVFINGKFELSLTLAEVVDLGVKKDLIISAERLQELKSSSELGKLIQRTLEWALLRPRSVKETRDYLVQKQRMRSLATKRYAEHLERLRTDEDYKKWAEERRQKVGEVNKKLRQQRERAAEESGPDYAENNTYEYSGRAKTGLPTKPAAKITNEQIEQVINKLIDLKVLDDKKFAEWFVENRKAKRGVSRRQLQLELAKKGIGREVAEEVLRESGRDEVEEAGKMVAKKWEHYGGDEKKLTNYLARQGFGFEIARRAIDKYKVA